MATPWSGKTRILGTRKCVDDGHSSSRSLVVCIDGASGPFSTKNTNTIELYTQITKNDRQLSYYNGLGAIPKFAGASLRKRLSNNLDLAIGRNLRKVIISSYRWLSNNYQVGDRIFLFGQSRGAYQVRALVGMIDRVGLLLPEHDEQIPAAFELYMKTEDDDGDPSLARPASVISKPAAKESKKKAKYSELAKTFQKTFCRGNVHIHFIGAWDTMSSVGFGGSKTLPGTTSCQHICYFRHALTSDERHVEFLPKDAYGGRSSCSDDGRIEEVWFAGSHSDVGSGSGRNEMLQSDESLKWMRSQAIAAGLTMDTVHNDPVHVANMPPVATSAAARSTVNFSQLIHASHAALELWRQDKLLNTINILSQEIRLTDEREHLLASRALLRARLHQWDLAIRDARKSIGIKPTILAYIAISIAFFGRGNTNRAKKEFNQMFLQCSIDDMRFIYLIRAVIAFTSGNHEEGILRVAFLIVGCPEKDATLYHAVQARMYVIARKAYMSKQQYDMVLKPLEILRDRELPHLPTHPQFECISLMFGWTHDSDGLRFALYQQQCEALYALHRQKEAIELLRIVSKDTKSETRKEVKEWLQEFAQRCGLLTGDAGVNATMSPAQSGFPPSLPVRL